MNSVLKDIRKDPRTATSSLDVRLGANRDFSSIDFQEWLQHRLNVGGGMDVLDVGCGTGAQSIEFVRRVGPNGSVCALDISADSVERLRSLGHADALQAEVSDMMELESLLAKRFRQKTFDLAQSTYALYYAKDPIHVLEVMRRSLKQDGRLAVCVPNNPHGLLEFIKKFAPVPEAAEASGRFGPDVLEPYFRKNFDEVDIHLLRNMQTVPDAESLLKFWRNTSYFDRNVESAVLGEVQRRIETSGSFKYAKNSFLIIGARPTLAG